MRLAEHPDAVVGWLSVGDTEYLAGHAFLIGRNVVLTCAHVVRDHLKLGPAVAGAPAQTVSIRFRKLDSVVTGRVLAKGWFPPRVAGQPRNSRLADVAIIRLDAPIEGVALPKLAPRPPEDGHAGRAYGAEEGYQHAGQNVPVTFDGNTDAFGRHPLRGERSGFAVARGFSGGPAMDRQGAIVWGMITTVDAQGRPVSHAIAAEYLLQALELAGVESEVRFADRVDEQAAAATAGLLAALADKEVERDRLAERVAEMQAIIETLEAGARDPETNAEGSAALAGLAADDPTAAAGFFREQVRKGKELADRGRRDAALASRRLGQLLALSNVAEAAAAFRDAVALDPTDRDAWFSLGQQEMTLGSLSRAADAFEHAQALHPTESDPLTIWPLFRLGDVRREQGDLAGALDAFQRGLDIAASLAASDPGNAGWQRDLSVSHNRIGDVRREQGDLAGALDAFQKSLDIAASLAASDPGNAGWQRDLSVSHERIGDVRREQGDLAGALDAFQKSLDIAASLAASDPSHTGWQRDLSVSHNKIGDVRRDQGNLAGALDAFQKGLDIAASLAASDPSHTGWQRDLSASHNKIGDVRRDQGNLAGALDAFQKGLDIAASLAASDPSHTGWQRDLSVSHNKIGDVRRDQGNLAGALDAFQKGLEIAASLATSDPSHTGWQRDLSFSHTRIGDIRRDQGDLAGALDAYRKALAISDRLARLDPSNVIWQKDVEINRARVARLEERAKSGGATPRPRPSADDRPA